LSQSNGRVPRACNGLRHLRHIDEADDGQAEPPAGRRALHQERHGSFSERAVANSYWGKYSI
jgi:hypothetical protein